MGAGANKVDVTVRIDKSHAQKLDEIVGALVKLGLDRIEKHARFMIVNGCVAPDKLGALRSVEGVASVREDETYKVQ